MRRFGGVIMPLLAAAGLALIISCGDDNPVGPGTDEQYPVYFYNGVDDDGWFFRYFPNSNTVDSFYLPIQSSYEFRVSAYGEYLYVGSDYTLAVIDLESYQVIKELPYTGPVAVSPDDRHIAILGNGIRILRTSDYTPVFEDTLHTAYGAFSADGSRFYCPYGNYLPDSARILVVDIRRHRTRTIAAPPGGQLTNVIPSDDESQLFLWYGLGSCASGFLVYDPHEDSVIFYDYLTPGNGKMILSADGNTVFYTNPGPWLDIGCCRAPSEIYAYNVAHNSVRAISTLGIIPPPDTLWLPMGELAVTPDNRWVVTANGGGWSYLLRLNVQKGEMDAYADITGSRRIVNLTCQSGSRRGSRRNGQ